MQAREQEVANFLDYVTTNIFDVIENHKNPVIFEKLIKEVKNNLFENATQKDLDKIMILSAASFIEIDPEYDKIASKLLLKKIFKEIAGIAELKKDTKSIYREFFIKGIYEGVQLAAFDRRLLLFDLDFLASKIDPERDSLFGYMSLHTLNERYLSRINGFRFELPQSYMMRIAMGLALKEEDFNEKAVEFYNIISSLCYVPSTPTLFHSGFERAQLSSCFLNVVNDDLSQIFKFFSDNAQLSKWAGGLGGSWTNIRAIGSSIKSIKALSQGIIPFIKIFNDTVLAITRTSIRRGGACVYLESWHYEIEDFLDLKRNTGDERRRVHDINTANWIPDLFMKRVIENKHWTLFSPDETPDLHDLYGKNFEKRYEEYEDLAKNGKIKIYKVIQAKDLWKKMLTRLFETGNPWITFKDACNIRSPQSHVGVIHSSNLCTEITLNTSQEETAVCNLGSINLAQHIENGNFNWQKLKSTVYTAVRMLDNVIDLNFYAIPEAKFFNFKHRPIGLGLMGFQDALFMLNLPFESNEALEFSDKVMEFISYYAIDASCELSIERGEYETFNGSKWQQGIFPLDTLDDLELQRGVKIEISRNSRLDWKSLKEKVKKFGLRNSNMMAIAPTATISTIAGCYPCIEPIYENIYVESNVSGEYTIVNKYLVEDLKALNLWNKDMLDKIKYFDGRLSQIESIPQDLKNKYKTAFELDAEKMVEHSALRAKWIDQSQSHNVFLEKPSGAKISAVYTKAWKMGLKTTYYLRTLGASQVEKSTLDAAKFGFTQKRSSNSQANSACSIANGPDCESCQ